MTDAAERVRVLRETLERYLAGKTTPTVLLELLVEELCEAISRGECAEVSERVGGTD